VTRRDTTTIPKSPRAERVGPVSSDAPARTRLAVLPNVIVVAEAIAI
jgi:hypothetical protein